MSGEPAPIRAIWVVAPVAVVMLFFVVLLATRDSGPRGFEDGQLEGELAPPVVGLTLDDELFDLDDLRGSFVVVNFFQTTCIPCRQEHPELVSFHEAHEPSGFASVVSVAFDDTGTNVKEFFDEFGGDWPVLTDDVAPIAVDYGVPLVPESIIVAPTGEVITKLRGGVSRAQLEAVIGGWQADQQEAAQEGQP